MPDRTVADNIRAKMALGRVTQMRLAAALGLAQSTVSDRQTNNSWPAADLPRVARVLGVAVGDLFEDVLAADPVEADVRQAGAA